MEIHFPALDGFRWTRAERRRVNAILLGTPLEHRAKMEEVLAQEKAQREAEKAERVKRTAEERVQRKAQRLREAAAYKRLQESKKRPAPLRIHKAWRLQCMYEDIAAACETPLTSDASVVLSVGGELEDHDPFIFLESDFEEDCDPASAITQPSCFCFKSTPCIVLAAQGVSKSSRPFVMWNPQVVLSIVSSVEKIYRLQFQDAQGNLFQGIFSKKRPEADLWVLSTKRMEKDVEENWMGEDIPDFVLLGSVAAALESMLVSDTSAMASSSHMTMATLREMFSCFSLSESVPQTRSFQNGFVCSRSSQGGAASTAATASTISTHTVRAAAAETEIVNANATAADPCNATIE